MKLEKPFKNYSFGELLHLAANRHRYTNFNSLGFFRAILEHEKLDLDQRLQLREVAKDIFGKQYEFLQVKDPVTFYGLDTLGLELTKGDEQQRWQQIKRNQEAILKAKQIKHRNFGVYSKHTCGYADCPYEGVMFPQGSWWLGMIQGMHFDSDHVRLTDHKPKRQDKEQRKFKDSWRKGLEGE